MCKNLQYYFESVYFKELHKDQSYNWPTTYGAGVAVVSTITSVNTELSSLRKQPTFRGATTCFPAKSWHVRNERRNSILMTHPLQDLGCPSNWLKQVSYRGTTNQRPTQIWVVTRHQYGILRSFLRRHFTGKPAVVSRNVSYKVTSNSRKFSVRVSHCLICTRWNTDRHA